MSSEFWAGRHGKPPQPSPYSILKGVAPVTREHKGFELFAVQQARTGTWYAKALGYDDDFIGVGPDAQEALARAAMYLDADIPPREKMNPQESVEIDLGTSVTPAELIAMAEEAHSLAFAAGSSTQVGLAWHSIGQALEGGATSRGLLRKKRGAQHQRARKSRARRRLSPNPARAILRRAMRGT